MEIKVKKENGTVILSPMDKVDFVSAPELESLIEENAADAESMVIDMESVDYISSAGLRAILFADSLMCEKKGLVITNINVSVREILNISGFTKELNIK